MTEAFPQKVEINDDQPVHTEKLRGATEFTTADPQGELPEVTLTSGIPNPLDRPHPHASRVGIQDTSAEHVGNFNLVQGREHSWINDIEIGLDRRGEKLAVSTYLGTAAVLHEVDRHLESDPMGLSEHSVRVWESLTKRGVARQLEEVDQHGFPRFVSVKPESNSSQEQVDSSSELQDRSEPSPEEMQEIGEVATSTEIDGVPPPQESQTKVHGAGELTPPPGFKFNPDILEDYDEQVISAIQAYEYQEAPIPSFEGVPPLDIEPTFNPTTASPEEIYARDRVPEKFRKIGMTTHTEKTETTEPIEMWRIVDRSALVDGTGLVASAILTTGTLGDVKHFSPKAHLASHQEVRLSDPDKATPFVSFSTDPEHLAKTMIKRHGFGVKDGRDSVVVRVRVDPDRVISNGQKKQQEVLLLGGVAPDEYLAAYNISDFVEKMEAEPVPVA